MKKMIKDRERFSRKRGVEREGRKWKTDNQGRMTN